MLHLKYDWRRRILWVSILLSLFLSSQKNDHAKNSSNSVGFMKGVDEINQASNDNNSLGITDIYFKPYFYFVKE